MGTEPWKSPLMLSANVVMDNNNQKEAKKQSVPSNCVGLKDGEYSMRLIDDTSYPLVTAKCHNQYLIEISGVNKNDRSNWAKWFIPSQNNYDEEHSKFLVSPQCDVCDKTDKEHQMFGDQSAYYANPDAYGNFQGVRRPACEMDWNSYKCKTCAYNLEQSTKIGVDRTCEYSECMHQGLTMGACYTEIRSAFQYAAQTFMEFIDSRNPNCMAFKPSIGINGRFCQCFKPQKQQYVDVELNELTEYEKKKKKKKKKKKNFSALIPL